MELKELIEGMNKRELAMRDYVLIDWDELKGKTVLDIGTAYGIWSIKAQEAGGVVNAIDISPWWADAFKMITKEKGCSIPIATIDILNYNNKKGYDVVFALAILHHTPSYEKMLDKIFQLSNDIIYIEIPVGNNTVNQKHKKFGNTIEKAWYYVPMFFDLTAEIVKRGGVVEKVSYNNVKTRVFIKVRK